MANYFLNSDGSISTQKKKAGNHYRLGEDGKVSLISNATSSSNTLNDYQKRKKELETQLLNYKREESNPWWDKDDNVVENVGNVFHKLFLEKPEDRYKKDEQYDALEKEYAEINKKIDDYLVENKKYDKGLLGYAQKSADVTAGNVRTSVDGINSTILKATGQKPVVYDSYAERVANKAISQSKGAEKVGLEITGSVARMVPQMIMPTRKASYVMGFANYGGSAYNQAIKEGYDDDKATSYGVTIGGLEMGLQGLLGGLDDIYGSSIAGRATDKIMRKIINNPTLRSYITKVGGEFTEEYLQEFLNPIVRNVILEEENGADFWNQAGIENKIKQFAKNFFNEQNLYAGALGGLTSGIMDSPALFVNQTNSNSSSTKPTVPTVQEIVAQEKNSATVSNVNIPRLTSETDSGTSSIANNNTNIIKNQDNLNVKKAENVVSNDIMSNDINVQDDTSVAFRENNIAQSNKGVNVPINHKNTITLSNEQQAQLIELDNSFKSLKSLAERNHPTDKKFREKRIKGYAMEIAAQKREVIQGDWLIPIEGGLTQIELNKKIERLKSNYIGKKVTVDGNNGKIFGNSYGKVGVEFEDGTRKYVEKFEINPIEDIDAIIKQQKTLIVQQKYQTERNQVPTEQAKGNIPINKELLNKNLKTYTQKEVSNIESEKIKIAKSDNDISEFVEEAINTKSSNKTIYFGKINDELAQRIFEKTGINVKNYNLSLKAGNIKKILKDHGNPRTEALRGQIAVLKDDFKYIDDIILENDDFFASGTTEQGKPSITFEKNLDNKYMLVEYISDKHHNLEVQTMWKSKKKNSVTVLHENTPGLNTSKTGSDTSSFSDNNIPQINNNVKLPVISNNNTQNVENNTNKILNSNEISKISLEDANTTPILPNINVTTGRGESRFAKNIENKVNMLSKESKAEILDSNEVKYYQEVKNKASLEKAFKRLNEGGESETLNWFNKDSSKATDVDVAEGWILLKQYQDKIQNTTDLATKDDLNRSMVQVAKKMREMGTKAGQTVQAYNILNRLTPEGMVYYAQAELTEAFEVMSKNKTKEWIDNNREQFNLMPQETEFIMKTMQEVQQMEDGYDKRVKLGEIQKLMTDKLPPSKGSGIKAWMRISMLFNPKTQVRNVAGNAIIAPVNAFSDLFASAVDKQIAKKTGVRTTGNIDLKKYLKGFKEGAYQSYNDFKKGINTRNIQGNRFEITEGKSFNDNTSIGKALNRVDSLLSFMLDAGDRTFYEATFTNSVNNQLKLNNTTEVTQAMIDIATTEALSRTWQDNNGYTRFVLNIRKGLNALNIGGYGLGDVLIPFAKTPANLTKAIVDYSPAGMIKAITEGINLNRSLSNGQYNVQMQHKFVQDLGKATVGTMLYVLGIALAKAGITTGESDDDKDVANFMKNTLGISSYSIKIGNKSFTYDWAQPIAAPLAITANIVQKQKDGASLKENIMSSLDTAGNILLEQSFLESLNTVLSNNEGIATGIQEAIFELPSRAVPTLFKQISDLIDPVQRQSFEKDKPLESAINKVKAKVPILSKNLAPSVDTMGREIQKYGGKNNIFNVFLNPANVNTENISKSAQEIYRLYKETGETNIMPRVAPYYINQDGEKINLNSSQREKYQKVSGQIIEDNINKLLKTTEYKNMTDKEKAEVISGIVNYSYNIAKKEILDIELSNVYEKAYEYSKIGDISDYYSFKASIDDTNKDTKKSSITNYLINSKFNDKQLAFLYSSYYSSEETLNNLLNANIPIKEFIKFNIQEFTTDYYTNGKAVTNSRRNKVIKYVNSLNLSIAQKAILIKMEYSSYDKYDKQIVSYINKMNYSKFEKASLLKSFGFDYYDKYLIQYVNKMKITKAEKEEMLKEMGFTIRNGRVYS